MIAEDLFSLLGLAKTELALPLQGKTILENMARQLAPDGFLFLGGAETVIGITEAFLPMPGQRGIYVPKDSPHLQAKPAE